MNNQYGFLSIGHLYFSDISYDSLIKLGICTIHDLVNYDSHNLLKKCILKQRVINEINNVLSKYYSLDKNNQNFEWYEYHDLIEIKSKRLFYYSRKLESLSLEILEINICHLHLDKRTINTLSRFNINCIGELIKATRF